MENRDLLTPEQGQWLLRLARESLHNRIRLGKPAAANLPENLESGRAAQFKVEQDELYGRAIPVAEEFERLAAVALVSNAVCR